jgi:hypothetical protein
MEFKSSLPCSQQPATCSYREPGESTPNCSITSQYYNGMVKSQELIGTT